MNDEKEIDDIVAPIEEPSRTRRLLKIAIIAVLVLGGGIATHLYFWGAPASTTASAQTGRIKGNKNSRIYHLPGCVNYDDIKENNVVWFSSQDEARQAGFRKARNCD